MEKLDIEFKHSSTGMYSPWHLDIAHKYNVSLMCTCDIGHFVKIGDDIYKLCYPRDMYKLYEYVTLEKCSSLDEFEKKIIDMKRKYDKQKQA